MVTYTAPTAVDEAGEFPAVICTPASGSTFPFGTTTVTCTATDLDDLNSPVTASFTVTVNANVISQDVKLTLSNLDATPADNTASVKVTVK